MNLSEARENLSSQLGRYFGEIALSNHIVKNKIEVGLSLVDSLVKDPANCKEYTLTAKTLQFTLQISQKMGLQDIVERSIYMYLTDSKFRQSIHEQYSTYYTGSAIIDAIK